MILVTGATGLNGRELVRRLSARGVALRAMVRNLEKAAPLAALPNVTAKHSGLGMPVLGLGPLPREQFRDTIAPLVTHLDQAFGPQRTFWASNYPIDKPNVILPDSIWALRQILGGRFDEQLMLRDNARRVYRI